MLFDLAAKKQHTWKCELELRSQEQNIIQMEE